MSEKIEQYQKEINDLVKSIDLNYEKMSRAGIDYFNEIKRYLKKLNDYVDVVYDEGLNDAWECAKKIADVDMGWDIRHKIFNDTGMVLSTYGFLSKVTPEKAIEMVEKYEEDKRHVSRHSIIKTKLNEIKDMFDDPVTNEELIEILKERRDINEVSI